MIAKFQYHVDGYYIPANSAANAATALISNRYPRATDMVVISKRYEIEIINQRMDIKV